MDVHHVLAADIRTELTQCFEERQTFDVADCSTDLSNTNVVAFRDFPNPALYLIRHMRDDLDGSTKVVPAPLLSEHRVVNLTGSDGVPPEHLRRDEPFVMAEVEIGLCAVIGDENFTMLKRRHRSRIDVQIWVALTERHPQPPALKERCD